MKKKHKSQIGLIFEIRNLSYGTELSHWRQTQNNHEEKFSIIQNKKKQNKKQIVIKK
jgi:hypothetical protein